MDIKPRHGIWLLYCLGVGAYGVYFHLFARTDEAVEGGGRFFGLASFFLIIMILGTLSEERAERRKKKRDEDEPPSE